MGQQCSCLKDNSAEDLQFNINSETNNPKQLQESAPEQSLKASLCLTLPLNIDIDDLVKLQAVTRGYIDRRLTRDILRQSPTENRMMSGYSPQPRTSVHEIQGEIPNYSNASTIAASRKLGAFNFEGDDNDGIARIQRGPVQLENGAVYIGEWNDTLERHGKGTQVWCDGSKYEGYWKRDRANGKGRLIHGDGDVYEGE